MRGSKWPASTRTLVGRGGEEVLPARFHHQDDKLLLLCHAELVSASNLSVSTLDIPKQVRDDKNYNIVIFYFDN